MTPERAIEINAVMVDCWMIREGLKEPPLPDVTGILPRDAVEASNMMMQEGLGRRRNADGSTTLTCFVEPTRVQSLYAWALATWADGGMQ